LGHRNLVSLAYGNLVTTMHIHLSVEDFSYEWIKTVSLGIS
jgi:hypothetical protein